MKRFFFTQLPMIFLIGGVATAVLAWQTGPVGNSSPRTDTIPQKNKKVRDIDDAINEIEKGQSELDRSLREKDWNNIDNEVRQSLDNMHVEMDKLKDEIKAMKEIDGVKVQEEVQRAMKELNSDKIRQQVDEALKSADEFKIQESVDKALKQVDFDKIRAQVNDAMARIDWDKINEQIEKAKDISLDEVDKNIHDIQPRIEKSLEQARTGLEKAKNELHMYKELVAALDRDGLINKKGSYSIEYKTGQLILNGKLQTEETTRKYRHILENSKDFHLTQDENGFNIDRESADQDKE